VLTDELEALMDLARVPRPGVTGHDEGEKAGEEGKKETGHATNVAAIYLYSLNKSYS
jgi:hypothetical protein